MSPSRVAGAEYESKHGRGNLPDEDFAEPGPTAARIAPPADLPGYGDEGEDERTPSRWTGGADLGLLLLRLVIGGTFIAHGSQKLFGVLGGPGKDGFAKFLYGMGFHHIQLLTYLTGGTEIAGGALLVLGLFTPLAAAGLLAVVGLALGLKVHPSQVQTGFGWLAPGGKGFDLELSLAASAVALLFAGPGRIALDFRRAWWRKPLAFGFVSLLIAGAAAAGIWFGAR